MELGGVCERWTASFEIVGKCLVNEGQDGGSGLLLTSWMMSAITLSQVVSFSVYRR